MTSCSWVKRGNLVGLSLVKFCIKVLFPIINMISVQLAVVVVTFPIAAIAALCGTQCDLYSLKWQQEFEESTVDNSVWNFRLDQKAYSAQLAANVEQADGNLVVNLKKQKVGNNN